MSAARRWIPWALVTGGAVVGAVAVFATSAPSSDAARWDVVDLSVDGRLLRGRPVDLIGVGDRYVGLVDSRSENWIVTSSDGRSWNAFRPQGLPTAVLAPGAYPGGLNNVAHRLFTDGDAVYLRVETGSSYDRLGSTVLYVSDAEAREWKRVGLRVPAGKGAFPIAAASTRGRRYLAGAVYDPVAGRSYLDAAVWVSDGNGPWRSVDAPAFSGDGNQTVFSLAVDGRTVVAGGGDGALLHPDNCCYYPDGIAFWHSTDGGERWRRATVDDPPYAPDDRAAVVGFRRNRTTLDADISGYPPRTARSRDLGATWTVAVKPQTQRGVLFPRVRQITPVGHQFVATTEPASGCSDCTRGAIARSADGVRWRDVTPRFPCGTDGRSSYGFVSPPVLVGETVVALGGCGKSLGPFDETLLAVSRDCGRHWRIRRHGSPTGGPISAVAGHRRIVTLAAPGADGTGGPIRAVVVH